MNAPNGFVACPDCAARLVVTGLDAECKACGLGLEVTLQPSEILDKIPDKIATWRIFAKLREREIDKLLPGLWQFRHEIERHENMLRVAGRPVPPDPDAPRKDPDAEPLE